MPLPPFNNPGSTTEESIYVENFFIYCRLSMICLIVWQVFLISLLNVSKCEKHIYMYNDFFAMHILCFRILLYVLRLESYYPILMFLYLYNTCFNTNSHTHLFLCCFYFVTIWAGSSRGELAESSKQAHGVSIQSRRKVTASS